MKNSKLIYGSLALVTLAGLGTAIYFLLKKKNVAQTDHVTLQGSDLKEDLVVDKVVPNDDIINPTIDVVRDHARPIDVVTRPIFDVISPIKVIGDYPKPIAVLEPEIDRWVKPSFILSQKERFLEALEK